MSTSHIYSRYQYQWRSKKIFSLDLQQTCRLCLAGGCFGFSCLRSEVTASIRPPVPACNIRLSEANSLMSPISFHHCHHAPLKWHNETAAGIISTPEISCTSLISNFDIPEGVTARDRRDRRGREMCCSHRAGSTAGCPNISRYYLKSMQLCSVDMKQLQKCHRGLSLAIDIYIYGFGSSCSPE